MKCLNNKQTTFFATGAGGSKLILIAAGDNLNLDLLVKRSKGYTIKDLGELSECAVYYYSNDYKNLTIKRSNI